MSFLTSWVKEMEKLPIDKIYGYSWGDPRSDFNFGLGNYLKVKDDYILPYIKNKVIMEIGSLDGKWIQFFNEASKIICVDLVENGFERMKKRWPEWPLITYKTSGSELMGIESNSVDFVLTIDSLVRVDKNIIKRYIFETKRVLKLDGKMCLHFPCSNSAGSNVRGFTKISLEEYKEMLLEAGFSNFLFDTTTIEHGILILVGYE
jgi:cyclopropane fatty-acyl-phospholipid synthase-like methyltransferase